MNIREIFSPITRRDIKEVVKVDDEDSVLTEIEEYVLTEHIKDELIKALDIYQETLSNPSHEINLWVSGFFGSGKSSYAKVLGYLLANPVIDGKTVSDRFFELNNIPKAQALLQSIHATVVTKVVLLDLNTSPNVLDEGESIVLPIYRTLLRTFDYSVDLTLSELEWGLENEGTLSSFIKRYEEIYKAPWTEQRDVIIAKSKASRVLHELDPETYPAADSWSKSVAPPTVTTKWFVHRAGEILDRRCDGRTRMMLVVDEVGQYVARSTDRMRHLQGLSEECQKTEGRIWLVATSQEKLTDVVDSLEGKQTELAKAQDRFPIRIDLLPSDIDEVTGKRVLDKTADGASQVRSMLAANRNKLTTSVSLHSERHQLFADDDFVRLYPLVPYQLRILIDAVSARRAQGSAPTTMGGSNRTLIRHAHQLIYHPDVGLGDEPVGKLVTLDRSYRLLEDVIPTAWRYEVDQVVDKHGADSFATKVMRIIALCSEVPGIPLTTRNLAVMLHPAISADSVTVDVTAALQQLESEQRIREGEGGYRLQSPEQKNWEITRRGIEMKPSSAVHLKAKILKDELGSLTVTRGRAFKVELFVENQKVADGNIALDIRDEDDVEELVRTARLNEFSNRIFWSYRMASDTWDVLAELHRSVEMIDRYDNPSLNDEQRALLLEERNRRDRFVKKSTNLLVRDLTEGSIIFNGNVSGLQTPPMGWTIRSVADNIVLDKLDKIYPERELFATDVTKSDILAVLSADTLDALPDKFGPDGLGLFRETARGRELASDVSAINAVTTYIESRNRYDEIQTGAQLESYFGGSPYGATVESLQAVLAAAIRSGQLKVVSQAARITSSTDSRLESVFGQLPKFRAATFRPADDSDISLEMRGEIAEWLGAITGELPPLASDHLAVVCRSTFEGLILPCSRIKSTLDGLDLVVPAVLMTMHELLDQLTSSDDKLVIETVHKHQADLEAGKIHIKKMVELIETDLGTLRMAIKVNVLGSDSEDDDVSRMKHELSEILNRARYDEDIAQIKTLTYRISDAINRELESLRTSVEIAIAASMDDLRSNYPLIEDAVFVEHTKPLDELTKSNELRILQANSLALEGVVRRIDDMLAELSTTRNIRSVRISDIWKTPITSLEDLDSALTSIREAILNQLADDTEVRLQ